MSTPKIVGYTPLNQGTLHEVYKGAGKNVETPLVNQPNFFQRFFSDGHAIAQPTPKPTPKSLSDGLKAIKYSNGGNALKISGTPSFIKSIGGEVKAGQNSGQALVGQLIFARDETGNGVYWLKGTDTNYLLKSNSGSLIRNQAAAEQRARELIATGAASRLKTMDVAYLGKSSVQPASSANYRVSWGSPPAQLVSQTTSKPAGNNSRKVVAYAGVPGKGMVEIRQDQKTGRFSLHGNGNTQQALNNAETKQDAIAEAKNRISRGMVNPANLMPIPNEKVASR